MTTSRQLDYLREQREFEARLDRLEVTVRNRIGREINRYIRAYAKAIEGGDQTILPFLQLQHQDNVQNILQAMIGRAVPPMGRMALRNIESQLKQIEPSFWQRLADRWILTRGLEQAKGIAETSVEKITATIAAVRGTTISNAEVANEIRKVSGFTPARASMIARTETHNAATFASESTALEAQQDLNVQLLKFWIPVRDSRSRDTHAAMINHEGIPLDQKFRVGSDMMSRPGDPAGSAANVIHCRCTLIYREREIEING